MAHADVFEPDPEKLERMVQRAAEQADGLQWRRALAIAATEELGIGLGEALGHPTVARAQALVGAPSYEEGLAAITEGKARPPAIPASATATGDLEEPAAREADHPETQAAEVPAGLAKEGLDVHIGVLYLDGLPELSGVGNLELRFSEDGLDIVREIDDTARVHFDWTELQGVEVQPWRARRRRRHSARVIVSATSRQGTFETRGSILMR